MPRAILLMIIDLTCGNSYTTPNGQGSFLLLIVLSKDIWERQLLVVSTIVARKRPRRTEGRVQFSQKPILITLAFTSSRGRIIENWHSNNTWQISDGKIPMPILLHVRGLS